MRGGYDRVEGSIGRSCDEIKGVTMSMSRNFHMLGKITIGEKVEKFDCLSNCPLEQIQLAVCLTAVHYNRYS